MHKQAACACTPKANETVPMQGKCRENSGRISSKRAFFLLVLWVTTLVCLPCSCTPHYKLVGGETNRRPRTAAKSLRKRYEGPWVWLAYREGRYLFSTHIISPYFLTFVRRVNSQTFEGGIGTPRFLAREWIIGNRIDRVMSECNAGA